MTLSFSLILILDLEKQSFVTTVSSVVLCVPGVLGGAKKETIQETRVSHSLLKLASMISGRFLTNAFCTLFVS